jgi:methionyl-tRNA synthetase
MEQSPNPATPAPPQSVPPAIIEYADFAKIQLRVATVIKAETIEKSKKLLRLQIDLGNEHRQILAGIKEHYAPDTLVGKQIIVVANLAPREVIRGEVSEGMLLAATDSATGNVIVISPEKPVAPGSGVK